MTELFPHQKEGIEFLKKTPKAILADSMGIGKTRQAIVAAGEQDVSGVLVICPASVKINWQREIAMVYPEDDVYVVESGPEQRLPDVPWLVINYDMLEKYKDQILQLVAKKEIDTAIIDEAHYIKGKKTIRADATLEIVKGMERVYCLTGTPIMNRPIELFNLLKAIGHPLSKSRTLYGKKFCGAQLKCLVRDKQMNRRFFVDPRSSYAFRTKPDRYQVMMFNDESGATHLADLRKEIDQVFLRRTKKEVLNLPEKIISIQVHQMDDEWRKEYETAWDRYVEWISNNPDEGRDIDNILSAQALVELMKLKQVCAYSKIRRISEDVINAVEQDEKVIIFTQFQDVVSGIMNNIERGVRCVKITGSDDMDARQSAVDSFQNDPETKVIICNIKAGGVGINLTAASTVIFADMDWSPEVHAQAEDRAHRIGQNGTLSVYYYVVEDSVEEDIIETLEAKRGVIEEVFEGKRRIKGKKTALGDFLDRVANRVGKTPLDTK